MSSCSTSGRGTCAAHRQRRDHEPRRDRGRALAGVAGDQPGARTGPAPSARDRRSWTCSTTGWRATRRASTPTRTASTTRRGRRSWTPPGGRSRKPSWRRCSATVLGDLNAVRGLGGLSGESYVDKDLRRCWASRSAAPSTSPTAVAALWRSAGLTSGPRSTGRGPARGAASGGRPGELAKAGGPHGLRPWAHPEHVPDDQPADLPAGARALQRKRAGDETGRGLPRRSAGPARAPGRPQRGRRLRPST